MRVKSISLTSEGFFACGYSVNSDHFVPCESSAVLPARLINGSGLQVDARHCNSSRPLPNHWPSFLARVTQVTLSSNIGS